MKTLDIQHVSFAYSKKGPQVLKDVSFSTEEGDLLAVLGPNGVGKSTLFKCMLGFMKKYEGKIFLNGADLIYTFINIVLLANIGFRYFIIVTNIYTHC